MAMLSSDIYSNKCKKGGESSTKWKKKKNFDEKFNDNLSTKLNPVIEQEKIRK